MKFQKTYEYGKEPLSKKDYIKDFLEGLYSDLKCPTNLFDGLSIIGTEEYTETIGYFIGTVEADFTANVGYERKEQYETSEMRYVPTGGVYKYQGSYRTAKSGGNYLMDVTKERTVIDWMPMSIHETYQDYAALNCETWKYLNLSSIFDFVVQQNGESFVDSDKEVEINRGLEQDAINDIESRIKYHKAKWPTEHVKDVHGCGSAKLVQNACFIVPCYKVDYSFEGKTYRCAGFAVEYGTEVHEIPEATNNEDTEQDIENLMSVFERENNRIFKIGLFVGLPLLIVGLALLFVFLSLGITTIPAWAAVIAGFSAIVVCGIIKMIRYNKQRQISDEQRRQVRLMKAEGLKRFMLANGYSEKDFEELNVEGNKQEDDLLVNDYIKKEKQISILFYVFGTLAILGILINMIIGISVWGFARSMYVYPLYGYIGGFIVTGLSVIGIVVLFFLKMAMVSKSQSKKKHFIAFIYGLASIVVTSVLMIVSYHSLPSLVGGEYSDGTVSISTYHLNDKCRDIFDDKLVIPSHVGGKEVVEIQNIHLNKVKSIVIPNTVKTISSNAFVDCGSLEKIYIPSSVNEIGEKIFSYNPKLTIFCEDSYSNIKSKEWEEWEWRSTYYTTNDGEEQIPIQWGVSRNVTNSW